MFLIVRLLPEDAIGLCAAALATASGQIGAVNLFVQVGFSAAAGHADQEQALKTMARHFRFAALAVIVVGLLAAAVTPWGIRLFFGAKFIGANAATLLLIGATAFWGMATGAGPRLAGLSSSSPGNLLELPVGKKQFGEPDIFVSNARPQASKLFYPPMDITLQQWVIYADGGASLMT